MEKLLTAEEFLKSKDYNITDDGELYDGLLINNVLKDMIEFTKLHVEAALKAANEKATILEDGKDIGNRYFWDDYNTSNKDIEYEINKDSILNAYPLDNIK
jgi:hypothetical protein